MTTRPEPSGDKALQCTTIVAVYGFDQPWVQGGSR